MSDGPDILTAEQVQEMAEAAHGRINGFDVIALARTCERLREQRGEIWDALDFAARFVRAVFDANDESHVKGEWPREVLARAERALKGRDDA